MSLIDRSTSSILATFILLISSSSHCVDGIIGVTWGRNSATNLVPSMVVDLLLQNQIKMVKILNSDLHVIKAFSGTGIAVDISINNSTTIADENAVRHWIKRTICRFHTVNFRYISVGNLAFSVAKRFNRTYTYYVERVQLVQSILDESGYGNKIKAVITHTPSGVLTQNNSIPSEAEFTPEVREAMLDLLTFNDQSGAPFIYECFPMAHILVLQLNSSFVFSDDNSSVRIMDKNGLVYTNLFDLIHDSFIWALRKVGYNHTKVIVGGVGYPTDGYAGATIEAAEKYWKSLLPRVLNNRGTPLQPGVEIDTFIHSLTDEKNHPGTNSYAKHWGIYWANGKPKYKIDLTGQGRDIYPNTARGNNVMPSRWCVFNGNMKDLDKVMKQHDLACSKADCTSLTKGSSCGRLSFIQNVSYAFNAYFQSQFQDERACMFKNLGKVVLDNPSQGDCVFSIEVVKGTQPPAVAEVGSDLR